jgi:hypothetical protein
MKTLNRRRILADSLATLANRPFIVEWQWATDPYTPSAFNPNYQAASGIYYGLSMSHANSKAWAIVNDLSTDWRHYRRVTHRQNSAPALVHCFAKLIHGKRFRAAPRSWRKLAEALSDMECAACGMFSYDLTDDLCGRCYDGWLDSQAADTED